MQEPGFKEVVAVVHTAGCWIVMRHAINGIVGAVDQTFDRYETPQ